MPVAVIEQPDVKLSRAEQSQSGPRKFAGHGVTTRHNLGPGGEGERDDPQLALLEGKSVLASQQDANPVALPLPEMLTKRQAAALMQISIRTLDRLVVRGDVPHVRLSRRCVRFPVKALQSWLESRTQFRK